LPEAKERLPREAIEQKEVSRFRNDADRVNGASTAPHVEQQRWRLRIEIPYVVVHDLEVPEPFAGVHVDRDDAAAEEIVSKPVAAEAIPRRRSHGHVKNASLDIDRHEAPDVDAGASAPAVGFPRVMAPFTVSGHCVECPDESPRQHVP